MQYRYKVKNTINKHISRIDKSSCTIRGYLTIVPKQQTIYVMMDMAEFRVF
jgi:hypothetical protein